MDTVKKSKISTIVSFVFFLWAAFETFDYLRYGFYIQYYKIIRIIAFVIIAYGVYKEKRDITVASGFTILLAVRVCYFFLMPEGQYGMGIALGKEKISLVAMLPAIIEIIAGGVAMIISFVLLTELFQKYKNVFRKVWFLPTVLIVTTVVVALIIYSIYGETWWNSNSYVSGRMILFRLIYATLYFAGMLYVVYPERKREQL